MTEPAKDEAELLDQVVVATCAFMVECKRRASIAVYDWLDQCTRAARPGQIPLVVARGDRREAVVILRLDDFLPMLGKEKNNV